MGARPRRRHPTACSCPTPRSRAPTRSRRPGARRGLDPRRPLRPRAHRPQLGRRRHRPGRPGGRRAPRPSVPHRRAPPERLDGTLVDARCEHDDGWMQAEVELPAVLSCAERLCEPAKVDPPGRAAVPADRIRGWRPPTSVRARGAHDASPTWVGPVKVMAVSRARIARPTCHSPNRYATRCSCSSNGARCAATRSTCTPTGSAARGRTRRAPPIVVIVEPDRTHATRELLGRRRSLGGRDRRLHVVAITVEDPEPDDARQLGRRRHRARRRTTTSKKTSRARSSPGPSAIDPPWAIVTGSTAWGREVASRVAARLGAGLTGDAVDLEIGDGRLVAWKPAFGGQLVAAIGATSAIQMATVRAGMITAPAPRRGRAFAGSSGST